MVTWDQTTSSKPWAILIGIDQYSRDRPGSNLNGCVNDVSLVFNYLMDSGWSRDNIAILIAPHDDKKGSTPFLTDTTYHKPTRRQFFRAIEFIQEQAKEGDVVLIHYSGHGDRRPTKYPGLKGKSERDELLCLLGSDLSDVKLGSKLDGLAKRFTVVITLDCCHSGGATRGEQSTDDLIRCWPREELRTREEIIDDAADEFSSASDEEYEQSDCFFGDIEGTTSADEKANRNASRRSSWLHRARNYNVLCACQDNEKARETSVQGVRQGVWTRAYMEALNELGERRRTERYAELHKQLRLKIEHWGYKQKPLHFGLEDRQIFGANLRDTSNPFQAYVCSVNVDARTVKIDRGVIAGVRVDDIYHLTNGDNTTDGYAKLQIMSTEHSSATGSYTPVIPDGSVSDSINPQVGWIATLEARSESATVRISYDTTGTRVKADEGVLATIRSTWHQYNDPITPILLEFEDAVSAQRGADFIVRLEQGVFTFRDFQSRELLQHFPTLPVDVTDVTSKIMGLLQHLKRIEDVRRLCSPSSQASKKPYRVTFKQRDEDPNAPAGTLTSWDLKFKNCSRQQLYVTVINLLPLYGMKMLFPNDDEEQNTVRSADRIKAGATWKEIIDINMPDASRRALLVSGSTMKDEFKIFISTQLPHEDAFRTFDLDELKAGPPSATRAEPRRHRQQSLGDSWWVEPAEIVTKVP